jgi:Ca-activated chloride channel family protein
VNGRVTVGEVREKQSAEAAYAAARERGQRASLVVQKRPNMFRTQVANIGPGESVEIAIGYTNLVEFDHGQYRTRIPLAMTPRYGAAEPLHPGDRAAQPDRIHPPFAVPDTTRSSVALSIDLDAGVAVAELMSLHHRIQTVDRGDRYEISLDGVDVAPDRDFELTWRSIVGAEPAPVVFVEEFAGASHALLTLLPPQEKRVVPLLRELIFVIDTSGSMQGDSIVQAKSALQQGLGSLRPGDAFNVIQFNSTTESLFAASIPFTPDNVLVAREYVDALVANGGTEMAPALAEAFRLPVRDGLLRQVVFITDGAVGNERSLFMLIENEKRAARLFTVGIGSAPNGHFMRSAARVGRGTHTFIGSGSQVAERMNELLTKLESPIVTDIRVDWPGQETAELAWRASGDLYAGEPLVIAARLPTAHAGLVTVSGRTAGSPWVRQIPLPAGDRDRIGIAGTWARMRVDEMLDAQRRGVADDEIRAQVLPLALEYQIVSPYTSLVAVEQQVARAPGMPMEKAQLAATIPHGSAMTLSSAPATATGVQRQLLLGLTLLVLGAFARARALRLAQ